MPGDGPWGPSGGLATTASFYQPDSINIVGCPLCNRPCADCQGYDSRWEARYVAPVLTEFTIHQASWGFNNWSVSPAHPRESGRGHVTWNRWSLDTLCYYICCYYAPAIIWHLPKEELYIVLKTQCSIVRVSTFIGTRQDSEMVISFLAPVGELEARWERLSQLHNNNFISKHLHSSDRKTSHR